MRWLAVAIVALAASCGRYGFDAHDAPTNGDASVDGPPATPALVNSTTQNAATSPVAFSIAIGIGHLVVVAVLAGDMQIMSIADGANTYVPANVRELSSGGEMVDIWYAVDSQPVTGTMTVTLNTTGGSEIWVAEFSGIATSSPLDSVARNTGPTSNIAVGAAITTTRPNELVFTILGLGSNGGVTALAGGNPFTGLPILEGDDAAYDVAPQPGTYTAAWAITSANTLVTSSAGFLPGTL